MDEIHQHLCLGLFFQLFFAYQYDLGVEAEQGCLKQTRRYLVHLFYLIQLSLERLSGTL